MRLLLTGAWQEAKDSIGKIEKMGHQVLFLQQEKETLPCEYAWVEGIVGNGIFLHHPIEKFVNLEYIQLTSAGFDRVPMDYVNEFNITIHNARGVYSIPMAEFAFGGVLQLYKQTVFFMQGQREHQWNKHRGLIELYGKTVGVVGCGSVGTECAKRFKAFGCEVIGVDLYPREDDNYDRMFGLEELDDALSKLDIIILTLPLTDQTKYFINAKRFSLMKKGTILVNIARGAIIHEQALVEALKNNLGGAVLDVFEQEPLDAENPLWDMENVIITPHNSFVGTGNSKRLTRLIIDNLKSKEDNVL